MNAEQLFIVGIGAAATGHYDSAIKYFQRAIEIKPDYEDAYFNMGLAYSNLKEHKQ